MSVTMNLQQHSKEFYSFLVSLVQECPPTKYDQRQRVFNEEYAAVAIPPGTSSVFTNFTGPQKNITILISKYETAAPTEGEDTYQLCASMSETYEEKEHDTQVDDEMASNKVCPFFRYEAVNIGQPLSQKRVYLSEATPLYAGQATVFESSTISGYESRLVPLSLDKARYISSLYCLGCREVQNTSFPNIWVICKSEKQKIVGLGFSSGSDNSLFNYTLFGEDPLTNTEATAPEKLLKNKTSNKWMGLNHLSGSTAYSEYQITTSSNEEDQSSSGLALQFAWSDPDSLLCPPPESSDAVLKISTLPGYKFSPVFNTFTELDTLLHFCKISSGISDWLSQDSEELDNSSSCKILSTTTDSFLEAVSSPLTQPLEVTVVSPMSGCSIFEPRQDLDFVERLWVFAKEATSLEDLQQVFADVFKAVLLGRVQPFIHGNSTSVLATLLRQVLLCTGPDKRQTLAPKFQTLLTNSKVLPCLIELGLEKLKRDYRAFFIGTDVATSDQLDQFFTSKSSLLEQCHSLCNLHCVLELNATAISFLNLPTATLSLLTKKALEVYKERGFKGFETTPMFSLPLPAYSLPLKSIIPFCASLIPRTWTLSQAGSLATTVTVYKGRPLLKTSFTDSDDIAFYVYRAQCSIVKW